MAGSEPELRSRGLAGGIDERHDGFYFSCGIHLAQGTGRLIKGLAGTASDILPLIQPVQPQN